MLKAREEYDLCRGVLDLTKELDGKVLSETELLAIRGRANAAHATIVVLPDTAATQSGVKYIYDRLVVVWVSSTKPVMTVTQAYKILSCGGYGAITVGEGNLLSFKGVGTFTYALEYEYKAYNIDYTIYTEPVTVMVKGENQGLSVGAIVAICAAAVLAGVIVVVLKKKK